MTADVVVEAPPLAITAPGVPALPQVNLLPPEVRAGRQLDSVKRWLALTVLVVLVLAALVVGWASMTARTAEAELADTEAQNQQLILEQKTYAEVPQVLGRLAATEEARRVATAREVLWQPYVRAIAATAPDGVGLDTVTTTVTPDGTPPTDANPLVAGGVGSVAFTATSTTMPDTAAWLRGLDAVPGLQAAWFSDATLSEEGGAVHYTVSGTVQLTADAYAERFAATAGGATS